VEFFEAAEAVVKIYLSLKSNHKINLFSIPHTYDSRIGKELLDNAKPNW